MAAKFDVPFLGKIPLDTNMLRCCESGKSFTDTYPDSPAAPAFLRVVDGMRGAALASLWHKNVHAHMCD